LAVTEGQALSVRTSSAFASPAALAVQRPLGWIGRWTLVGVADLGRIATLLGRATRSIVQPPEAAPPLRPALVRELAALLAMGMPLVALVHVGMGSFLSLQAYYGGTFVDGTGAVVGVGLIRNAASMMAGLTMAGLIGVRTTAMLRTRPWRTLDVDPLWIPDRDAAGDRPFEPLYTPDPARLASVRILAAIAAGPIMGLWGSLVGTVVGWKCAQAMLGVSTHGYFSMMWEMLWLRDVTGLVIKGLIYGLLAGLFACHEGLRGRGEPEHNPDAVGIAAFRAICLASVSILVVSSGWFLLFYHAGPAFGPTLLAPKGG
jgi:phospholipid/cholesterol/gamma-HCH transport system permease protein